MKPAKDATLKIFAKNLVRLRKAKKMTQEQLAEAADISAIYVAHLEQGRKSPSLHVLAALTRALNVSIKAFFKGISR